MGAEESRLQPEVGQSAAGDQDTKPNLSGQYLTYTLQYKNRAKILYARVCPLVKRSLTQWLNVFVFYLIVLSKIVNFFCVTKKIYTKFV